MRLAHLSVLIMIVQSALCQDKVSLSGFIEDESSGEKLIGSTVFVRELNLGVTANQYGFYSFTIAQGNYVVEYRYVGYQPLTYTLRITENIQYNALLKPATIEMKEVTITGKAENEGILSLAMSRNEIDIGQMKKLPPLFGIPDVIKNVQMLPGVVTAGEGTSSFYVRGGSADQNMILIDEAPVYDPSHFFGLFSIFNTDVIKTAELYKGGIPSRYGGRLSSILDIRTKDGNDKSFQGSSSIGLLAASIMLEGPIKKEKASFLISARRSYFDIFTRLANSPNTVFFDDVNAKINFSRDDRNKYYIAFYSGRDQFDFNKDFGFNWGNTTTTLRWNHLFNSRVFSNTSLIHSNFNYGLASKSPPQDFNWTSKLEELALKEDLNYFVNPKLEIEFGYHLIGRAYLPAKLTSSENSITKNTKLEKIYAVEHGIYLDFNHQLTKKLSVRYGSRVSMLQNLGPGVVYSYDTSYDTPIRVDSINYSSLSTIKRYINLEPRLSARYSLNPSSSIKASYNRTTQNTHIVSNATVPLPFSTWYPSSYYLKPQIADQVAVGYFRNFKDNKYEVSAELYAKEMQNVTDFADHANIFFNKDLQIEFRQGRSLSRGLELMLQRKKEPVSGMIAYTFSKTTRKIPDVNQGQEYPSNFDRRHVLNMTVSYEIDEKWTIGANFTYQSGRPITLPSGKYRIDRYEIDLISTRNGYRLPDYHRFDFSATLRPLKNASRKWKSFWVFSLYNAYGRKNPFTIYTRVKQDVDGNVEGDGTEKEARLLYLFGIVPSVSYNVKF